MRFMRINLDGYQRTLAGYSNGTAPLKPLAVLRIGVAIVLLAQSIAISEYVSVLFGENGLVQWSYLRSITPWYIPSLCRLHSIASAQFVFSVYFISLIGLIIGYRTRVSSFVCWITHMLISNTGFLSIYGVDQIANVFLFYLVFFPTAGAYSIDRRTGAASGKPSVEARLAMRVLLVQMIIIYLSSGIEKASGIQWWNGEAIFRSLMRDDFCRLRPIPIDFSFLAFHPWIAKVACWTTMFVEIGYIFAILPRFRKFFAAAAILLHLGIALFLGLISFAAFMIALNLPLLVDSTKAEFAKSDINN